MNLKNQFTNIYQDISQKCIYSVSSSKTDSGIQNILDNNRNTFWQSDGMQPHKISFQKLTTVTQINIYVSYESDESYTPKLVHVYQGLTADHMELLAKVTLSNPEGWVNLFFDENTSNIKCYLLEIDFVKMQDNGKDCHIRQINILGPKFEYPTKISRIPRKRLIR